MSEHAHQNDYRQTAASQNARLSIVPDGVRREGAAYQGQMILDLIDDRALDRECLAQSLISHGLDMDIVMHSTIESWKTQHSRNTSGVLLNIGGRSLTDENLVKSVRDLVGEFSDKPVIILAENYELRQILLALDLGVRGFIPSDVGLTVCVGAISLALSGGVFISTESLPELRRLLSLADQRERKRAEMFTPREEDVIKILRRGKPNKIIAYELALRESTVKVHVRNIMKKLNARNRTEVIFKINSLFD